VPKPRNTFFSYQQRCGKGSPYYARGAYPEHSWQPCCR